MSVETKKPTAEREVVGLLRGLTAAGPEAIARRVAILRRTADRARESAAARSYMGRLLDAVAYLVPDEAATFRAVYLDGDVRPTGRQTGRRFCMDVTTVHRHTWRVFEAMLPAAFGLYGVFLTDTERESTAEKPGTPPETTQGAGEGQTLTQGMKGYQMAAEGNMQRE